MRDFDVENPMVCDDLWRELDDLEEYYRRKEEIAAILDDEAYDGRIDWIRD